MKNRAPASRSAPDVPAGRLLELAKKFWNRPEAALWFKDRERVLVGVSGGADSMALLWLMAAAPARPAWAPGVVAAHVHHGLRGKAADADQAAAAALAAALGVPFRFRRLNGEKLRRDAGGSLEDAMRRARFAALGEILRRTGCRALVLAHHQDDLAETFLMRLLRGSGLTGLAGFGPLSEVAGTRVIRPLIDWPRARVREVARLAGIAWREDASNRDPAFLRNRVRRTILPCLNRVSDHGPAAPTLARTARLLEREQGALNAFLDLVFSGARLERQRPRRVGLPRSVLLENDAVFAPYLLRRLFREAAQDPYPPSEKRIRELEEFARDAPAGALLQTARNVVVWAGPDGALWAYRKPRRLMPREKLLAVFRRK